MLELTVRKTLGQFHLDVTIAAGHGVTALFGPSGSGKTSLAQMVAGLSTPDQGRIRVDGQVLYDSAARINLPPERRGLGYVFQDARLFPHLSVRQNLLFGHKNGQPCPMDDVIALLGIDRLLDRHPQTLSGGEKQRVAIGRALLANPRILIMDEPLAALDQSRKGELLPFLVKLVKQTALPILYVSHAMEEVIALADTLVLIDQGRVAAQGPVADLLARPDLRPLTGRINAGAILTTVIAAHDPAAASTTLTFAGGQLEIGRIDRPVGDTIRLRVQAKDVGIALDPPGRTSVRNHLSATIQGIHPTDSNQVDIMLDISGTPLWAQISRQSLAELQLAPGMAVWAMVKAVTLGRGES